MSLVLSAVTDTNIGSDSWLLGIYKTQIAEGPAYTSMCIATNTGLRCAVQSFVPTKYIHGLLTMERPK